MTSISLHLGQFPRGTICAVVGFGFIAAYYLRAWRKVSNPEPPSAPNPPGFPESPPWSETRYLQWGTGLSILIFVLAGAADAENDWLDRLVGALMGFCGALGVAMFGFGLVSLTNLWKELVLQLKKAKMSRLSLSIPMAILWLATGLGVFFLAGMLAEKLPKSAFPESLPRLLIWGVIALMFWRLWKDRSHTALVLRLILLVLFSVIILAAAAFGFWWISSQTALLLVVFLTGTAYLNVAFYSRWVRDFALRNNLDIPPGA